MNITYILHGLHDTHRYAVQCRYDKDRSNRNLQWWAYTELQMSKVLWAICNRTPMNIHEHCVRIIMDNVFIAIQCRFGPWLKLYLHFSKFFTICLYVRNPPVIPRIIVFRDQTEMNQPGAVGFLQPEYVMLSQYKAIWPKHSAKNSI